MLYYQTSMVVLVVIPTVAKSRYWYCYLFVVLVVSFQNRSVPGIRSNDQNVRPDDLDELDLALFASPIIRKPC